MLRCGSRQIESDAEQELPVRYARRISMLEAGETYQRETTLFSLICLSRLCLNGRAKTASGRRPARCCLVCNSSVRHVREMYIKSFKVGFFGAFRR